MNTKFYIFYKTVYIKTGQYYYGSHHGTLIDSYRGSNKIIKSIQRKYGNSVLTRENLRIFDSPIDCFKFEDRFLKLYDLANDSNCLNMKNSAQGGDTWKNMSYSDKTKRKELLSSKISGKNNGNYGNPMPIDRKEKMILSKLGKSIHSDEYKKNTSIRVKQEWQNGKRINYLINYTNNRLGKSNSTETNTKISNSIKQSATYKQSRVNAASLIINRMNLKLKEVKQLIVDGLSDYEIINLYDIKPVTLYSWKKKIKDRNI